MAASHTSFLSDLARSLRSVACIEESDAITAVLGSLNSGEFAAIKLTPASERAMMAAWLSAGAEYKSQHEQELQGIVRAVLRGRSPRLLRDYLARWWVFETSRYDSLARLLRREHPMPEDEELERDFAAFIKTEFSHENMVFWKEV